MPCDWQCGSFVSPDPLVRRELFLCGERRKGGNIPAAIPYSQWQRARVPKWALFCFGLWGRWVTRGWLAKLAWVSLASSHETGLQSR